MEEPGPTASLKGSVVDTDGVVIANAVLALCSSACYGAATDAKGEFEYVGVPADHYKLEVRGAVSDLRRLGVAFFPLDLPADETVILDSPVVLPETGEGVMLQEGTQTIAVDSELSLELDGSQLMLPFGEKESYLAGVRVQEPHWLPHIPTDGSVVGVWSFNPYGMTSMVPVAFNVSSGLGQAASSSLDVHTVSVDDAELKKVGTATVNANGDAISTDDSMGITEMSWLVLTTE